MLMLDLCAGLGGASHAMRDRGWSVITLDNDPTFGCDVTADLRDWTWQGAQPDLLWISPPCIDFARDHLPWIVTTRPPDMSIVLAAQRIITEVQPRYWVIENVVGALRWFYPIIGAPRHSQRPYFLWGRFPPLGRPHLGIRKHKQSYSSSQRALRSRIPYAISSALAVAVEAQQVLL
jgi:site-specific DNA-cytosine methylase